MLRNNEMLNRLVVREVKGGFTCKILLYFIIFPIKKIISCEIYVYDSILKVDQKLPQQPIKTAISNMFIHLNAFRSI